MSAEEGQPAAPAAIAGTPKPVPMGPHVGLPPDRPLSPAKRRATTVRREEIMEAKASGKELKGKDQFNDQLFSTEMLVDEMHGRKRKMQEFLHVHQVRKVWEEEVGLPYAIDKQFDTNVLEFVVRQDSLVIQDGHRDRFHSEPDAMRKTTKQHRSRMKKLRKEKHREKLIAESEERSRLAIEKLEAKPAALKPTAEEIRMKEAQQRTKERDKKAAAAKKAQRLEEKEIARLANVKEPQQYIDLKRKAVVAEENDEPLNKRDAYMLERLRIQHNQHEKERLVWAMQLVKKQKAEARMLLRQQRRQAAQGRANNFSYSDSEWALRLRRWKRQAQEYRKRAIKMGRKIMSRDWRDDQWETYEQELDTIERNLREKIRANTRLKIPPLKKRSRLARKLRKRGCFRWVFCCGWLFSVFALLRYGNKTCLAPFCARAWAKFKVLAGLAVAWGKVQRDKAKEQGRWLKENGPRIAKEQAVKFKDNSKARYLWWRANGRQYTKDQALWLKEHGREAAVQKMVDGQQAAKLKMLDMRAEAKVQLQWLKEHGREAAVQKMADGQQAAKRKIRQLSGREPKVSPEAPSEPESEEALLGADKDGGGADGGDAGSASGSEGDKESTEGTPEASSAEAEPAPAGGGSAESKDEGSAEESAGS